MPIRRTLPPAAAPIYLQDIVNGFKGMLRGRAEISRFQRSLEEYFKVDRCFLISSGKAALTIILRALKLAYPERDEVIIPAYTCYSVPSAVIRAGLKVHLCDINPETLDYNFEFLKDIINSPRLLAVISNHLFGLPADIKRIQVLLSSNPEISVVEDAAQAMGGIFRGNFLGTYGKVGFFSLGRGKALSTVEGGIILVNSSSMASKIETVLRGIPERPIAGTAKNFAYAIAISALMQPSLFWIPKSIPSLKLGETIYDPEFPMNKFSGFQAGLARSWPDRLAAFLEIRKAHVTYWRKALGKFPWLQPITTIEDSDEGLPLLRLPVRVRNQSLCDALVKISTEEGLGIMPTYPDSINNIKGLMIQNRDQYFHGAAKSARRVVTFPVHKFITARDRQKIISCLERIQSFFSIEKDWENLQHYNGAVLSWKPAEE